MSMVGTRFFCKFCWLFLIKVWIYVMKSEGKWLKRFLEFEVFVETQWKHVIKAFWWVSKGNFISRHFEVFWGKMAFRVGIKTLNQRSVQIGALWRWQSICSKLKSSKDCFGGSGGECSLHTKPMSNEGIGLHCTWRNVERVIALCCIHACIRKHLLCNGSRQKEGQVWCERYQMHFSWILRENEAI